MAEADADAETDADARAGDAPRLGEPPGPILASDAFVEAGRKAMWPHVERLLRFEQSLADAT